MAGNDGDDAALLDPIAALMAALAGIQTQVTQTNATAIKLANFFDEDPESWFRTADIKFHLSNVTSSRTKACHMAAKLDAAMDRLIRHIPRRGSAWIKFSSALRLGRNRPPTSRQGLTP